MEAWSVKEWKSGIGVDIHQRNGRRPLSLFQWHYDNMLSLPLTFLFKKGLNNHSGFQNLIHKQKQVWLGFSENRHTIKFNY